MTYSHGVGYIVRYYAHGTWHHEIGYDHSVSEERAMKCAKDLAGTYKHVLVERVSSLVTETVWESGGVAPQEASHETGWPTEVSDELIAFARAAAEIARKHGPTFETKEER